MFDKLPEEVRQKLENCSAHGLMANGTELKFYGILQVSGYLRDVKFKEILVVSQIREDAILGMPFLVARDCTMSFERPVVTLEGRELPCTDGYGQMLASKVQVPRSITLMPDAGKNVQFPKPRVRFGRKETTSGYSDETTPYES